jgi:hypothetical protein
VPTVNNDLVSHSATGKQRANTITLLPAAGATDLNDFTSTFQTQYRRHTSRRRIHTAFL